MSAGLRPSYYRLEGAAHVEVYRDMLSEKWGWSCSCGAESRYLYGAPTKAERLARVHANHCRGARRAKPAR